MIATRAHLHELVDQLAPEELTDAARYLEDLRAAHSPAWRAAQAAPLDDEPLVDEDQAAIAEGLADFAAGHTITDDELHRELGLPPHQRP
ncbi:MAG TPA: hypothetical protein VNL16_06415 [Chloroflexota bacterium]|nr:hypothetical protein [Chloroflexota bacterium]